ncbi:fibronectin type III domain-containing protein, partial [Patescibacteria group bacterium]|nr:fibronectin type III domain-containing protein [Patescibacteria group bacterium]
KNRLVPFTGNSLIWDQGLNPDGSGHAIDTSHANRYPDMAIDAVNAGIGALTKTDLTGLSNLLTAVIWDQSLSSPQFTNYIDGNNDPYGSRPAWNDGLIYIGWVKLSGYDNKVLTVADAVLKAIMAGVSNPSLDYNSTYHGKIALSGHLAKAVAGIKDTSSPSVSITSPASGATVSGAVTVSASASDNVAVAGVQFKADGSNLGSEVITAPYSISWNTATATNAMHTLTAVARDAAGNTATSTEPVTVNNPVSDTIPPSTPTNLTATAVSSSQINLSWIASTDTIGVTGYKIYRNGSQIATVATTSYSDTGLTAATTYTYTVAAYDAAGNTSAQSSSVSATTQSASTQKFQINDRVQTTAALNVRSKPKIGGGSKLLGTQPLGALGTVIGGPQTGSGYTWWNINYDNPPDGWSVQNYLQKVAIASAFAPAPVGNAPAMTQEERSQRIVDLERQLAALQAQVASLLNALGR